jgi:hypothetical protein
LDHSIESGLLFGGQDGADLTDMVEGGAFALLVRAAHAGEKDLGLRIGVGAAGECLTEASAGVAVAGATVLESGGQGDVQGLDGGDLRRGEAKLAGEMRKVTQAGDRGGMVRACELARDAESEGAGGGGEQGDPD